MSEEKDIVMKNAGDEQADEIMELKDNLATATEKPTENDNSSEEEEEEDEEEEDQSKLEKIKLLPGSSEDGTAASFQIMDEDHTLGNALKQIIIKNPDVEFCGYSIPHPSEPKLHLRIQTYENTTAVEALHKGLDDLVDLCNVIEEKFSDAVAKKSQ